MHCGVRTLLVNGIPCSARATPELMGSAPARRQPLLDLKRSSHL